MAIAPIITGGFGTFADVNDIPTRGFSIGEEVIGTVSAVWNPRTADQRTWHPASKGTDTWSTRVDRTRNK